MAFKWWEAWEEDRQPEENLILVALHKITLKWGYFERIQRDFLYTIASSSKKCKFVFAKPKIEQIS